MKKIIELTIPVLVGLTWGALVVSSVVEVEQMAAAVFRPRVEETIEVRGPKPASRRMKQAHTRLANGPLIVPETVG